MDANSDESNRYGHCVMNLAITSRYITVSIEEDGFVESCGTNIFSLICRDINSTNPVDPGVRENEFAVFITSVATI